MADVRENSERNGSKSGKLASECTDFLAEIVGEESLAGKYMDASSLLDLMDLLAGRLAFKYAAGPCATVSIDRVDLVIPIVHADLVRVEGRVASVGASSIVIHVKAYRHDIHTRVFKTLAFSYITFVSLDPKTLRPKKDLPPLIVRSEEERELMEEAKKRRQLSQEWTAVQRHAAHLGTELTVDDVEDRSMNANKREFLSVEETKIVVRKQMLPRFNNQLDIIFGGDVLRWMLNVAVFTAKRFTGNQTMVVTSMNRVDFREPIKPHHVVEMHARVVSVRHFVLEVEIDAFVEKTLENLGIVSSHAGYFTVLNLDELGFRRPIMVGLRLSNDDQDGLRRYAKAKARRDFDKSSAFGDESNSTGFWMT